MASDMDTAPSAPPPDEIQEGVEDTPITPVIDTVEKENAAAGIHQRAAAVTAAKERESAKGKEAASTPTAPPAESEDWAGPYIQKLSPVVDALVNAFNKVEPIVDAVTDKASDLWEKIEPYQPLDWSLVAFGFICAFFGGHFVTTIAAIEAFKMAGWDNMKKNLKVLRQNYIIARDASAKDDLVDDNKDGIADVKQISKNALVKRKLRVVMKSIGGNIDELTGAVSAINAGCLAVIATLRVQFAQAITLGSTIGGIFASAGQKYLQPIARGVVPPEYRAWIPTVIDYLARAVGISVAWFVQRALSAFHSAIRGGQMFTQGLVDQLLKRKYLKEPIVEGEPMFTAISMGVAFLGFFWQFWSGFTLPFPLNILLFPFSIVEVIATWLVNDPSVGAVTG